MIQVIRKNLEDLELNIMKKDWPFPVEFTDDKIELIKPESTAGWDLWFPKRPTVSLTHYHRCSKYRSLENKLFCVGDAKLEIIILQQKDDA